MKIRYAVRRLSAALFGAMIISAPLVVFLFPVTVIKDLMPSSPQGVIVCPKGTEFISFRPLWQMNGLPVDATGLVIQSLIVLSLSVGVWTLYPAFKPMKP